MEKGDVPPPALKRFISLDLLSVLNMVVKTNLLIEPLQTSHARKSLQGAVKQWSEQHERNNDLVLGYFRGGQGSGFNDLMVTAQLQIRKVLDGSVGPSDIGIDRSRTRA